MSENRVFRKIFVPKKEEISEHFIKTYNEERLDLYRSFNVVRILKFMRI